MNGEDLQAINNRSRRFTQYPFFYEIKSTDQDKKEALNNKKENISRKTPGFDNSGTSMISFVKGKTEISPPCFGFPVYPCQGSENKKGFNSIELNPFLFNGWETKIRTWIHGVRVRCPTVERSPSSLCQ